MAQQARNHRALDLQPPDGPVPVRDAPPGFRVRHDLLGGLSHEYDPRREFANLTGLDSRAERRWDAATLRRGRPAAVHSS